MAEIITGAGGYLTCPICGGGDFLVWTRLIELMASCLTCGKRGSQRGLQSSTRRLHIFRVYKAILYLSERLPLGPTRRQIADHLGLSKSPELVHIIEGIASTASVVKYYAASPLNGRRTWFYLYWVDAAKQAGQFDRGEGLLPPSPPNGCSEYLLQV